MDRILKIYTEKYQTFSMKKTIIQSINSMNLTGLKINNVKYNKCKRVFNKIKGYYNKLYDNDNK